MSAGAREAGSMGTRGLLVRLKAKAGKERAVEECLRSALAQPEPGTLAWFAVRFGPSEYGIVDMFPVDAEREAHLKGAVARAFMHKANDLFESAPSIQPLDVLANKLPKGAAVDVSMGILLRFKRSAWFALRSNDGEYDLFDVFPDHAGRSAHRTGHVPGEFVKHPFALLGSAPNPTSLPTSSLQSEFGTFR